MRKGVWCYPLLRYNFEIMKSVRRGGFFDAPFDLFKEKKFSSLRRDFIENWKGQKWKKPLKFRKMVFYKQILDFHCPSKILCHTSKLWSFVKITGPYCTGDKTGMRIWCVEYFSHIDRAVLRTGSVADPDPGSGPFLTPGSLIRDG